MIDQQVHHPVYGLGTVLIDNGSTLVVRFVHGIEEVESSALEQRTSVSQAIAAGSVASPFDAVLRALASSIHSVNDSWGVFSRSRIDLLPHQLWVCHRALRDWPIRLLIADDVGLGKTIEAGLILWPLIARGVAKRVLILAPAGLVTQWQYRMRTMFDIRVAIYSSSLDTDRADFWNTHNQVVASLPTLRANRKERHERLLESPKWDMVIVDEAHHLNADESTGKTLGFQFLEKLMQQDKVTSCIFFTGTPHRGKPFGFWSLMSLLRPDLFDPHKDEMTQLPKLRDVLVRNAKQKVTDMQGKKLFQPIQQFPETYTYSKEEKHFYDLLTGFISSGKAYALSLSGQRRTRVMLVLVALQKLASSSVASVRAALRTRRDRMAGLAADFRERCNEFEAEDLGGLSDEDRVFREWVASDAKGSLQLTENEVEGLNALIEAAEAVEHETRIQKIIDVVSGRFEGEQVLLFTEYKATQALIVSALMQRFGENSVVFINGDDRLSNVVDPNGEAITLRSNREDAADNFNSGRVKFLVSTEAGGEGIDLQERCHCLVHADLPWNPMRLHQRVGRLNRYGQTQPVKVVSLRNPETIESRIWDKLESKLHHIMEALGSAMDEPEDLLQLVLGMSDPAFFDRLFSEAGAAGGKGLDQWFDEKAQTLGGEDVINAVKSLVGNAQGFNLSGLKDVPAVDLPDLAPFFVGMLEYNKRRPKIENERYTFKTPDEWVNTPGVRRRYESLVFQRAVRDRDAANRIVGVGHQAFDQALGQATSLSAAIAVVPGLESPIALFAIQDSVTDRGGQIRQIIVGVKSTEEGMALVRDWELVKHLGPLIKALPREPISLSTEHRELNEFMEACEEYLKKETASLSLPFRKPRTVAFQLLLDSK